MRATAQAVLPTTFGLIVPSGRSSSRATRPASSVFRKQQPCFRNSSRTRASQQRSTMTLCSEAQTVPLSNVFERRMSRTARGMSAERWI